MKTAIQKWINDYKEDPELFAGKAAVEQAIFARDRLAGAIARTYEECGCAAHVIGEHHSKSVKLPVVLLERPGLQIVLRDNFYNVAMSIKREAASVIPFLEQIAVEGIDKPISGAYCEGFPEEWVLAAFSKNPLAFTIHVANRFESYTLVRLASMAQS